MMAVGLGLLVVGIVYALAVYKVGEMTRLSLLMSYALWVGGALVLLSALTLVWRWMP